MVDKGLPDFQVPTSEDGYASLDDADLVQRIDAGDQQAFLSVYDRYAGKVYGLALKIMKDRMKAEDVAQEAFMKLWRKADTFNPHRGSLAGWLLTITRYTALDRIRMQDRRPAMGGNAFDPEETFPYVAHAESGGRGRGKGLQFALENIPEEQAQVIELAYFQAMSHSQIAEYLDIPLGTVKTRIRLGMDKLRSAWLEDESR